MLFLFKDKKKNSLWCNGSVKFYLVVGQRNSFTAAAVFYEIILAKQEGKEHFAACSSLNFALEYQWSYFHVCTKQLHT